MFELIVDYMSQTREVRRAHLRLDEPCVEIGGYSKEFRGLLAYHLRTTIPSGRNVFLCHACHNEKCSNVHHLYWGSPKDNSIDCFEDRGSIYERGLKKHGIETLSKKAKVNGKVGGHGNRDKPKSEEHRANIAESIARWHAERKAAK